MKGFDSTPIVCTLTTAELRDREARLLAQFRSAVLDAEELQEGYTFRLPGDGKWIADGGVDCRGARVLPFLDIRAGTSTE